VWKQVKGGFSPSPVSCFSAGKKHNNRILDGKAVEKALFASGSGKFKEIQCSCGFAVM